MHAPGSSQHVDHDDASRPGARAAQPTGCDADHGRKKLGIVGNLAYWESISMVENSIDRKKIRDELKFERAKLYEQFLKHPMDTRLALTIKIIDDEIADCTEWMRTKEKSTEIAKENVTPLQKNSAKN